MPFIPKKFEMVEVKDKVLQIAGGEKNEKGVQDIWNKLGEVCTGIKEAKKLITSLATANTTYKDFFLLVDYHYRHFRNATLADLAASLGSAKINCNRSGTIQNAYATLGKKLDSHREGTPIAVPLLFDGNVAARDFVNAEGNIPAARPLIEWYAGESSHKRFFTKLKSKTFWYTVGGTHADYEDPEWWISYCDKQWIKYKSA